MNKYTKQATKSWKKRGKGGGLHDKEGITGKGWLGNTKNCKMVNFGNWPHRR